MFPTFLVNILPHCAVLVTINFEFSKGIVGEHGEGKVDVGRNVRFKQTGREDDGTMLTRPKLRLSTRRSDEPSSDLGIGLVFLEYVADFV
jgi:hypothetical protein